MSETTLPDLWNKAPVGLVGFGLGAVALMLVLIQFFAGPFDPQPSAAVAIGEIAAEIRQSAIRALAGEPQPAPVAQAWSLDRMVRLAASICAGAAILTGLAAFIRRETWRPAGGAVLLGGSAVLFQFVVWAVLLVCGVILLVAILDNLGDILGG